MKFFQDYLDAVFELKKRRYHRILKRPEVGPLKYDEEGDLK